MIEQFLRSFPPFKGKQRIARLLLNSKISSGAEMHVLGKHECRYNLPNIQENIGFEILINGIYEADTIAFICKRMKRGGIFLDIGANIGAISIPVKKLRPDIEVTCIEAAPWIYNYLKINVEVNKLNKIELINKAISDKNGKCVDFFSPKDKFGKGSLAAVFTDHAVKVETITLDELIGTDPNRAIDFLKIDVEGFEALAFRGGDKLLGGKTAPDILFEFVDWAEALAGETIGNAQNRLLDLGYSLYLFEKEKIGRPLKVPVLKGSHMIFATKKMRNPRGL